MLVDAYRGEFGMIDMSYARFALQGRRLEAHRGRLHRLRAHILDWDHHMVTEDHVLGCNIPCIQAHMARAPAHTVPLATLPASRNIANVRDIDTAKALITYQREPEPISIAGRWDLNRAHRSSPASSAPNRDHRRKGSAPRR